MIPAVRRTEFAYDQGYQPFPLPRAAWKRLESRWTMNARQVSQFVESQIGDAWATTNHHHVDLRRALVTPQKITVIERNVHNGSVCDQWVDVWLVLVEKPETGTGYGIVLKDGELTFGLVSEGFPNDRHLVLSGWYGDFMSAFQGM